MKTLCCVVLLALASVSNQAWAVNVGFGAEGVDEVFFEKEMETRLSRDIAAYLGHDRFIIGVDFKLSGSRAPGGEDNVVIREITTSLPGLPKASETFTKELSEEELANLAETLFLDDQVGTRGSVLDGQSSNSLTGSGTEVYLVLDTTINSVQEGFVRSLIARKLSLDVAGGDSIQVVRSTFTSAEQGQLPQPQAAQPAIPQQQLPLPFPQFQQPQQIQQPQPAVADSARLEEGQEQSGGFSKEDVEAAIAAATSASGTDDNFWRDNLFFIIVIAMLLFLLLMLFVFLMVRKTPSYPNMPFYPPSPAPAAASATDAAPAATPSNWSDEDKSVRNSIGEIRREIASIGLASPETSRGEMDSLLAQNRMDIVAPVYKVLGESVFESLFGELSGGQKSEIGEYFVERDITDTQIEAQCKEFYSRLVRSASESSQGNRSHAFKFLDKLHLSQIMFLIKGEKARIQALIVSQLPSKKASGVLQSLESQQRSQIIHELAQFETFPVETFKDVATLLAKKARKLPSVENVQTDGIGILMSLLDNMNTVEEGKILSDLESKDPELHQKLRLQYFTFSDLARAPQKVMGEALLDVGATTLAAALTGADDGIIRRVLGSMPKRLADSVKEEMNLLRGKVDDEQIQDGRKSIVSRMRGLVREGKIDMEKL